MQATIYTCLTLVAFSAVVTIAFVFVLFHRISRLKLGNKKVEEIEQYIHGGAITFLTREYNLIIPFVLAVGVILTILGFIPTFKGADGIGWQSALCFVIGAFFSATAGWIGMSIATKANARTI